MANLLFSSEHPFLTQNEDLHFRRVWRCEDPRFHLLEHGRRKSTCSFKDVRRINRGGTRLGRVSFQPKHSARWDTGSHSNRLHSTVCLQQVHFMVQPFFSQQFLMGAAFDNLPAMQHQNKIGVLNR